MTLALPHVLCCLQASLPFSEEELDYIEQLDVEAEVEMLRERLPMLREGCLRMLTISTTLLQLGASAGLTLADIGGIMSRNVRGMEEVASELELVCLEALQIASSPLNSSPADHSSPCLQLPAPPIGIQTQPPPRRQLFSPDGGQEMLQLGRCATRFKSPGTDPSCASSPPLMEPDSEASSPGAGSHSPLFEFDQESQVDEAHADPGSPLAPLAPVMTVKLLDQLEACVSPRWPVMCLGKSTEHQTEAAKNLSHPARFPVAGSRGGLLAAILQKHHVPGHQQLSLSHSSTAQQASGGLHQLLEDQPAPLPVSVGPGLPPTRASISRHESFPQQGVPPSPLKQKLLPPAREQKVQALAGQRGAQD